MRALITDKHLLEMMWDRFPEIMKRGIEHPAQRTWVGLTDEEIDTAFGVAFYKYMTDEEDDQELAAYRAIEAKLKEKNT